MPRVMLHRSPGQNQGRRPIYPTPELAKAARKAARARADATNAGKLCLFSACTRRRSGRCDLCSIHQQRRALYGHPAAGPIHDADLRPIARHIRALITPYRGTGKPVAKRLDAQLAEAALATVERLVVAPGQRALPSCASALDRERHRLQHPPAPARPTLDKTGQPIPTSKGKPIGAEEALVAVLAAWCAAIIPGAITRPKRRRESVRTPHFPDEKAIACLVGAAVLTRRIRHGGAVRGTPKYELGRQLVAELAPMMPYVAALVTERMKASAARRLKLISKTQTPVLNETTTPTRIKLEMPLVHVRRS